MSEIDSGGIDLYTTLDFYVHLQTMSANTAPGYLIGLHGFNEGPKISNDDFDGDYNIKYYTRGYRCSFHELDNDDILGYYLLISDAIPTNIWDKLMEWSNLGVEYRRCITHNIFMAENNSNWSYNFVSKTVNFNSTTQQEISGNSCYFLRDDLRKLIVFAEFSQLTRNNLDEDNYSNRLVTDQIKYLCEKISVDCDTYEMPLYRQELQDLIDKTRNKIILNPDTQDLYKVMRYTRCYGDWFGFVFKPNWNKENDWFDKQIPDKYPTITKIELPTDWKQQINRILYPLEDVYEDVNSKLTGCLNLVNFSNIQNDVNAIFENVDNYLRDELKTMVENLAQLITLINYCENYFLDNLNQLYRYYKNLIMSYRYIPEACKQIIECSFNDQDVRFPANYKCYMNNNEPDQTESRKNHGIGLKTF